jgi:hypothetical protein
MGPDAEAIFLTVGPISADRLAIMDRVGEVEQLADQPKARASYRAALAWMPWPRPWSPPLSAQSPAYRHIATVLRSIAPDLIIDFDIACGPVLSGQRNRLDALTKL